MSKPMIQSATVAMLCLAAAASPALAEKIHHSQWSQQSYERYGSTNPYPSAVVMTPAAQNLVGRYTSQDFYPNPLVLNITGMDASGNLSGSMSGMLSKPQNGFDPAYENWQKVFGHDARAVYQNGKITITFNNGASYSLSQDANQLTGQYVAEGENRQAMSFMKSQIAATRAGY